MKKIGITLVDHIQLMLGSILLSIALSGRDASFYGMVISIALSH